jgi:photosystem II stability/assembly factor-like uncharacterized protein
MLKNKYTIMGISIVTVLAACNIKPSGKSTDVIWDTQDLPVRTVTEVPVESHVPSPTRLTPTLTVTATATINPLAIPRLETGSSIDILQVEMIDAQNGWGIGGSRATGNAGHVFRTVDGGTSWIEITPPETAASASETDSMAAVGFFADAQNGWVSYHARIPSGVPDRPVIWRTDDGGRTWQAGSPLATSGLTETFSVSHVVFAGTAYGWVLAHVGAGMNHDYVALYRSADGGANWTRVIDPMVDGGIQSCTKTGLAFSDGLNGWLTGNCNGVRPGAFLYRTADGGSNWEAVDLPAPADRSDLFTADQYACAVRAPRLLGSRAYLGVDCADMGSADQNVIGYLYRAAADGSIEYSAYPGGDLFTLDGNRIWALGKDIYRSDNGGADWTKICAPTWDGQFDFVTAQLGWAAVHKGSEYALVQTNDGGVMWSLLAPTVAAPA